MSNFLSEFTLAEQLSVSYLIGRAGGAAVEPLLVGLRQSAYLGLIASGAFEVPNAIYLAEGVAQGQIDPKTAAQWASFQGFDTAQFDAMINIANTGPPLASALTLLRRGVWTPGQYHGALNRAAIEPGWWDGLTTLQDVWLTAEQLAVMIQRSVVDNPGILPNQPDTSGSNVPPMPKVGIDPIAEAAGGGYNLERLEAMARIIGLPASPDLAARMHFRNIITLGAFNQAILEGNTRGEWAPFLLDGFRQIPTAEQFVEAHLRGWITQQQMYDGTALHGMSQADTDIEFQIHRRPMTMRQITQAEAWGGTFQPAAGEIQDPYVASAHQQNLGPEWYDLAESLKYTYSVPFWWRSMTQAGDLPATEAETILLRLGNPPGFAATTTQHFSGGSTSTANKDVTSAQTKLKTRTHSSYIAEEIDDQIATAALTTAGVTAAAIPAILALWAEERLLIRKQLSPTQIRKALNLGIVNPATGHPWTQADAIAAMLARGYDQADAEVFLQE